jgi:rubrerythrin
MKSVNIVSSRCEAKDMYYQTYDRRFEFWKFWNFTSILNRNLDKIRNNMDHDIRILGLEDFKRNQKLYSLLKSQYEAELSELSHYMELLGSMQNSLIRTYFQTLLTDGLKHVQYISAMMSNIEGGSSSRALTSNGIAKSISEEMESRDLLYSCIEMTDDPESKSILRSIIVDEDHHIKILEHISELIQSSSSKQ